MSVHDNRVPQIVLFIATFIFALQVNLAGKPGGRTWEASPAPVQAADPGAEPVQAAEPSAEPVQAAGPAGDITEKEAFESAKELGTIEAWEAFLKSFSEGFRADLARAYVRRLGNSQAAPAAAPDVQAPVAEAAKPILPLYSAPAGYSQWRTIQYEMDEGNSHVTAAAVSAGGLEFLMYCNSNKRLAAILREKSRGQYPEFDQRIEQGLEATRSATGDAESARISILFHDGAIFSRSAIVHGLNGEVSIGYKEAGGGFSPHGKFVRHMLADNSFKISAPPFEANFQLSHSRHSICEVVHKCGASAHGC